MSLKPIQKTLELRASREKVWNILVDDQCTRQWYAAFGEGTHAVTDWKAGSKVTFKDPSESGLIGNIVASTPGEILVIEYTGILYNGKEDYDSAHALQLKGGRESYKLSESNGITTLTTQSDMAPEFFESMSASWDKALGKIKELAEA